MSKGSLTAPEDSDDDSSDDGSSIDSARTSIGQEGPGNQETDALLYERGGSAPVPWSQRDNHRRRSLGYHIFYLVFGFLAICLAGYVLSHAATNITDAIGISAMRLVIPIHSGDQARLSYKWSASLPRTLRGSFTGNCFVPGLTV